MRRIVPAYGSLTAVGPMRFPPARPEIKRPGTRLASKRCAPRSIVQTTSAAVVVATLLHALLMAAGADARQTATTGSGHHLVRHASARPVPGDDAVARCWTVHPVTLPTASTPLVPRAGHRVSDPGSSETDSAVPRLGRPAQHAPPSPTPAVLQVFLI